MGYYKQNFCYIVGLGLQGVFNLQTKGLGGWFSFWKHWNWVLKVTAYF